MNNFDNFNRTVTPEKRREIAARAAATRRTKTQAKRDAWRAHIEDHSRNIAVLRAVRDDTDASPAARLRAVRLLSQLDG